MLRRLLIGAWMCATLLALLAMFHLWATREWRLYGGKSVAEQRAAVFRQTGLDAYLLRDAVDLAARMPLDEDYRISGDPSRLSYVSYLLIPRIPRPETTVTVRDTGRQLLLLSGSGRAPPPPSAERATPTGFLLSLALVGGLAAALRRWMPGCESFPQGVTLSLLLGLGLVGISRAVAGSAVPGFCLWAVAGGVSLAAVGLARGRSLGPGRRWSPLRVEPALRAPLAIAGVFMLWSLLMAVVVVADDWDAWAMWGAKAKVLALGAGSLDEVCPFGGAEYPLLWPALWAFTGWLSGGWEENWAKGWGAVLLLLAAWQLIALARKSAPATNAFRQFAPGLLFATIPGVALVASWGYVEPAYLLALACAWSGLMALRREPTRARAAVTGLLLAGPLYAKNEGTVFVAACLLALFLCRRVPWREKALAALIPGLLFLPWWVWTHSVLHLGTSNTGGFVSATALLDQLAAQAAPAGAKVLEIWLNPRLWGASGFVLAGLWGWTFLRHAQARRDSVVLFVVGFAYLAVIMAGRNNPAWQIGMSGSRLTMHLLLLMALVVSSLPDRPAQEAS